MAIKNQKSASEKLIYVGPNLSRGRLLQYQVFIGGLPMHLDEEFAAMPALKCLFVPVAELNAAMAQIKQPGTPLHKYYKEALEV